MFRALWGVLVDFAISVVKELFERGKRVPADFTLGSICDDVIFKLIVMGFGVLCCWLTFFVEGWVLVLGIIPFVPVALSLVFNFCYIACLFFVSCLSGFQVMCEGCQVTSTADSSDAPMPDGHPAISQESLQPPTNESAELTRRLVEKVGVSDMWYRGMKNCIIELGSCCGEHRGREISPLAGMMWGLDYFWIGNYATHISDSSKQPHWKAVLNWITLCVFTVLNIYVLTMDALSYREKPLSFFLGALCLRGIFLPTLVVFHPLVGFLFRTTGIALQWVFRIAAILAVLLTIGAIIGSAVLLTYLQTFRLSDLPPLPANWSNVPKNPVNLAICSVRYEGLSVIELLGLAFGGYDINRNERVFNRQMDFFFGPNATERIDREVTNLAPDVPLVIYNISGTTVLAFRGFASGPEFVVQVERMMSLWVVPFLLEELPLYERISDIYLSSSTAYAHLLGWHWFSPRSASDDLLQKAAQIYDDLAISADSPVLFVGVNSGGTIAKRLALLKRRRGISFFSLPIDLNEFDNRYDLDDTANQYITNIVNVNGLFSGEDSGFGDNFDVIGDSHIVGNDKVYESFCNLAELCGLDSQFRGYCETAIGEEQLEAIRAYLAMSVGEDAGQ
jgi:hypothetical protein